LYLHETALWNQPCSSPPISILVASLNLGMTDVTRVIEGDDMNELIEEVEASEARFEV
jgi:hypothetical protein